MKAFLEEYGVAIFTLACIALLIIIATPVGSAIKQAMLNLVDGFVKDPTAYNYVALPAA